MKLGVAEILKSGFSLLFGSFWFATAYVLMYIFHPVINELLKKCTAGFLTKISLFMLVFVSLYKTVLKTAPVCDFLFFVCIYVVIYTIENTDLKAKIQKISLYGFIILTTVLNIITISLTVIGFAVRSGFIISHSYYLNLRGSIFILADAVFLFYTVEKMSPQKSWIVNVIASTCFGVFLSHQGLGFNLWNTILSREFANPVISIPYMLFAVIVIFAGCSALDLIRQYTLGYAFDKLLSVRFFKTKLNRIDKYMNRSMAEENEKI